MSKYSSESFNQRTRPRSTFLLAEPPQASSSGSMSLRKRTSRLMTTLPVASSTSASQPPSPTLSQQSPACQCCGVHSKSLFELMEPRTAVETGKGSNSVAPKSEINVHYDCERKIRDLSQQLADAIDLAHKLRQGVETPKPNEPDSQEQPPQDISSHSSYALTVTDTDSGCTQLDDMPDEDWGFCYVDDGGRPLAGVVEEGGGQDESLYASRPGYSKPMTAQKRNRLSAVIGDNMLYLSELPVSEESPAGSSPGPSPGSSMSSSWTTNSDKEFEPLTPKSDPSKCIPTAVWHSSDSRKTREEPSERAMSCEVSPRENRTFNNPLGGRHGYINRKFRTHQMVGRSSVAAYRA